MVASEGGERLPVQWEHTLVPQTEAVGDVISADGRESVCGPGSLEAHVARELLRIKAKASYAIP